MHISAEMFEAITKSIRSDRCSEKRTSPRVGLSGRMAIVPAMPGAIRKAELVTVKDLSANGIGIVYHKALKVGEQFNLLLKSEKSGRTMTIICTVRWSRPVGPELHSIGASFETNDDEPIESTPA